MAPTEVDWADTIEGFALWRTGCELEVSDIEELLDQQDALADALMRCADAQEACKENAPLSRRKWVLAAYANALEHTIFAMTTQSSKHDRRRTPLALRLMKVINGRAPQEELTPASARRWATAIRSVVDEIRQILDWNQEQGIYIRRSGLGDGGRLPSVAMHFLLLWAYQRSVNLNELARRLVQAGVEPPIGQGNNPDPDPVVRWGTILRSAMRRFKQRFVK